MMRLSGSSMATPLVAGTAALLLQVNPKLTPNMVKMLLQYTALTFSSRARDDSTSRELPAWRVSCERI